jgi:class 3 adenylate cyclase
LDIAEFTRFSSQHDPDEVIKRLDLFLTDATEEVSAENGIVISYLCDGFLVTFNAPVKVETPADAAIRTAEALHATAVRHGFSIRIGIASGELVTGTIGSDTRQSFTVYGDPVNLASRLEAKCKSLGAAMLLDAATNDALSGIDRLMSFGSVEIDGLAEPVAVFGTDKP